MVHYREKEVKFRVSSFDPIVERMQELGAENLGAAFQRTARFDTEDSDLEAQGIFLRTRSGFKNTMTLKIKVDNPEVHERKEIEFEIDDVEAMGLILRELGFGKERIMEKRRSKWLLDHVEICMDELPFGNFIELEGEEHKIFDLADKLGLDQSKKIVGTYWDLFEQHKENTGSSGDHIVFST